MDVRKLHDDAVVVDTHNDLIVLVDHFDRRARPDHFGEFWLPELRAGGVNVQVLPIGAEDQFLSDGALRRALLLAERIHSLVEEHPSDVAICLNGAEVDKAVRSGKIALILALEGSHALGADPRLMRTMFRVGVRIASLAHYGRTFLADGSGLDDSARGGLTPEGIETFRDMERMGMVFDISHLGVRGVEDVLRLATRPLLATHSAALALTASHRNLADEQLKRIAGLGGVINVAAAIPYFIDPVDPSAERVVDHIEHIAAVAGIDHVGIGPDFIDDYFTTIYGGWIDGPGIETRYEKAEISRPSDLPKITEVMVRRGFGEPAIRKVLGENNLRVMREVMGVPAP